MHNTLKSLDKWKQTRRGLWVSAAVELILAYVSASWAIDSGNLWLYLLTAILLAGGFKNLFKLIGTFYNRK